MVSAIAVAGRIGLTAIGDSPSEAQALYRELKQTLDGLAAKASGAEEPRYEASPAARRTSRPRRCASRRVTPGR